MSWGRNKQNGVKAEGDLQTLLKEDGIFSLPMAPNIAGDLILPLNGVVIEVKRTKGVSFFPYQPNQIEQYEKLKNYRMEEGLRVNYGILFYKNNKDSKDRDKWRFFDYKEEKYKMRKSEGVNYDSFVKDVRTRVLNFLK